LSNYLLAAFGGTLWYFQTFFYTMGESQMGRYSFSSWTLHMASTILFSTLWEFGLKEWSGASCRTRSLVWKTSWIANITGGLRQRCCRVVPGCVSPVWSREMRHTKLGRGDRRLLSIR
jgi:hypothetical protein